MTGKKMSDKNQGDSLQLSLENPPSYFNRDLSWLAFNQRVFFQAQDDRHPLLERIRFLCIFSTNQDEFFMKRVGYLKRCLSRGRTEVGAEGSEPSLILQRIREEVGSTLEERADLYTEVFIPELENEGIQLLDWKDIQNQKDRRFLSSFFKQKIFPVLTPLAVGPAHPFPFLSNLSNSLGVKLHHPKSDQTLFARIKIPEVLPRWIELPREARGTRRFVALQGVIKSHLVELFPEMEIEGVMPFRVTRNADLEKDHEEEEMEDIIDVVEEQLRLRRMAEIVRLEYQAPGDPWILELLRSELDLDEQDFYEVKGLLDYRDLQEIANLNEPELHFKQWTPIPSVHYTKTPIELFQQIREKDLFVHFPFDSFHTSVEAFIKAAVDDPDVYAIKVTLYRTGKNSPIIPLLIKAAENGKQVVCVVELKASFDEARNIYWGEVLEKAGVHVVYGVMGLKIHTKIMLVVRKENENFRFYGHIGTGNYNADTAKLYTDFGMFTADPAITNELVQVFNYLTGLSLKKNYKKFLVSPVNMREEFLRLIKNERNNAQKGKPARIIAKMNSLEDPGICDALYDASRAGVDIDLIVRGLCVLRPKVAGLSERIRIISVIGRFLEHSRVFYFANGKKKPEDGLFYMGSADWMRRNLNKRVEAIAPVEHKEVKERLWQIVEAFLEDKAQSWELEENGAYKLLASPKEKLSKGVHQVLMKEAKKRKPPQL